MFPQFELEIAYLNDLSKFYIAILEMLNWIIGRASLKTIVPQMRSQIFRQIA